MFSFVESIWVNIALLVLKRKPLQEDSSPAALVVKKRPAARRDLTHFLAHVTHVWCGESSYGVVTPATAPVGENNEK